MSLLDFENLSPCLKKPCTESYPESNKPSCHFRYHIFPEPSHYHTVSYFRYHIFPEPSHYHTASHFRYQTFQYAHSFKFYG